MNGNVVLDSSALHTGSESLALRVRLDYPSGEPELGHWLLACDPLAPHISIAGHWQHEPRQGPTSVDRNAIEAVGALERGLAAMAVHLFGAVDMPPRISGAPLWLKARLLAWLIADPVQAYRLELTSICQQAVLREQRRSGAPWRHCSVELNGWDADPMRALLRQALAAEHRSSEHVPVRSRPPFLQPLDRTADPAGRVLQGVAEV